MKRPLACLTLLGATLMAAAAANAQGYYQNQARRNPLSGELEVIRVPQRPVPWIGPYRDGRRFYGQSFDPATGTFARSVVRRNPLTGRLEVNNQYFNPWTGANMRQTQYYNPLTRRYERASVFVPPSYVQPPPEQQPAGQDEEQSGERSRPRPRVIENVPTLTPPEVPLDRSVPPDEKSRDF